MALPKIDAPVYEIDLPLSKQHIRFRPFLVKEQRNLMMALEADDKATIEKNIRQVLHNCTLTEKVDIDSLPILDVEYYFLQLRARSVGEIVESRYRCENIVQDETRTDARPCGNYMEAKVNLLEIKPEIGVTKEVINLTDSISIKLEYPQFSVLEKIAKDDSVTDMAFDMIVESIEHILCSGCPTCEGRGSVKTVETVCFEILREITRVNRAYDADNFVVYASPFVAEALLGDESHALAELEVFIGKQVRVQAEPLYIQEQFDVVMM